jgi:ATP-binding cassette, subfamily B, bacterial
MKPVPNTLFSFLLSILKPYRWHVAGLFFVACFWAAYLSFSPYILKAIIDIVVGYADNTELMVKEVVKPCIVYVIAAVCFGLVFRFYDLVVLYMMPSLKRDVMQKLFSQVEQNSYNFFQQHFSGNISNKISDITSSVENIVAKGIDLFFSHSLATLIACISLYWVHPAFGLILFSWASFSIIVSILFTKKANMYAELASEAHSLSIGKVVDSITNILNVKLFAREGYESRYLDSYVNKRAAKERDHHWFMFIVKNIENFAICTMIALMIWFLIQERIKGRVTVGDFAFIITVTNCVIDAVWRLANELVSFSREIGQARQALQLLSHPPEIVDASPEKDLMITKGEIVFDKVHFTYVKGKNLFSNKSIIIQPGQKVGLVGFSGSGKSTFVNLILRFYDLESGRILIDGQDISTVTQSSLRSQIALIPQDPLLFYRSLFENIRFGRLDATDEEVIEAAKKAHAHAFITKLPDGYATEVGERGVKLSGGQRQRIAIARAILKNAPILILDEATSSLDSITESYIQESLAWLMKERTTLVIAHRLSTLAYMDRVLVFNEGKIVEEGTQKELLRKGGYFAELWNMQAGSFHVEAPQLSL